MAYELVEIRAQGDWRVYHDIRCTVLFEGRGRIGVYREDHEDELKPTNHPLLLKLDGAGIGTTRLDELGAGRGVVRLVAIRQDLQRRGHGRHLSVMVEEFAVRLGMGALYVNSARAAVGFYEKMGWQPYSWDPDELRGIAEDCVQMIKRLS